MSQPWTSLFQFNRIPLMENNLQDVTQEMADRAPAEGVNSITWLLTHAVNTRVWLLGAVLKSSYVSSMPEPKTLEQLKAAFDETHAALAEAFDAVADWSAMQPHPVMQTPAPLDMIVGTFFMHEAYHLGQIGVARKLMGLAGALKNPAEKVHA
jgi:uncharacterized damage-inducible protein DinB